MTFSRRAASEMKSRVERIAARVMGDKAATLTEGLNWAGTFHAVGARLLRGLCAGESGSIPPSPSMTAKIPPT